MNNLDNLRALAIGSVFLHHLAHASHIAIPFFDKIGGPVLGLHLFFLLSGYLITQSADKYSLGVYALHRVARIFPAHLFVFVVFGMAMGSYGFETIQSFPLQFIFNLTLLQQIYPESLLRFDITHVSWSLTVEVLWYLAAPLTLLGLRKNPFILLFAAIVLSTAWGFLVQYGALDGLLPARIAANPVHRFLFLNNSIVGFYCFFVMGGVIHILRHKIHSLNNLGLIAIFTLFISIYPTWFDLTVYPIFLTGVGVAALMIIALNSPVLESRIMKWIADISFSIYLTHFIILDFVFNHWGWQGWGGTLLATTLTLLLASLMYRFIEKPFMTLARYVTSPRSNA